jgi:hypothetical protein
MAADSELPTNADIAEQLHRAEAAVQDSHYAEEDPQLASDNAAYEEGVRDTIRWLTGLGGPKPLSDAAYEQYDV